MLNLIPAIRAIESEISEIKKEYNKKIEPLSTSLEHLRKINEACEGKGRLLRHRSCAEDNRPDPRDPNDWNTCPDCNGTGLAHYNKQQGYAHVPDISP